MSEKTNLLIIHGFNSSPESLKAQIMQKYMAATFPEVNVFCPQLATNTTDAILQLEEIITSNDGQWLLMGSSLGGYFAHYLADKYQVKALLINPAVKPYELLADFQGWHTQPYTGERYQITRDDIESLKAFDVNPVTQEKLLLVMVQTGDEVLDYRLATEKFNNCQLIVQQGGDHSFTGFDKMLDTITSFYGLNRDHA